MVLVLLVVRVLTSTVEVYMFYVCCVVGDTCDGSCIIAGNVVTLYTGLWVVIGVVAYTITCFDLCSAAFIGFCVIRLMPQLFCPWL